MEILTVERIKTICIAALAVMVAFLVEDNTNLRAATRDAEGIYQRFLAKKVKGKPIINYVDQTSLAIIPINKTNAVICGTMLIERK